MHRVEACRDQRIVDVPGKLARRVDLRRPRGDLVYCKGANGLLQLDVLLRQLVPGASTSGLLRARLPSGRRPRLNVRASPGGVVAG